MKRVKNRFEQLLDAHKDLKKQHEFVKSRNIDLERIDAQLRENIKVLEARLEKQIKLRRKAQKEI